MTTRDLDKIVHYVRLSSGLVRVATYDSRGEINNVYTIPAAEFEKLRAEFEPRGYTFEEAGG